MSHNKNIKNRVHQLVQPQEDLHDALSSPLTNQEAELTWPILVAENDPDSMMEIKSAFEKSFVLGRHLELVFAHTLYEAQEFLKLRTDWAVCILGACNSPLSEWIDLAKWMRQSSDFQNTRIALPLISGIALTEDLEYLDLNNYQLSFDLASGRAVSAVTSFIRSFINLVGSKRSEQAMSHLAEASKALASAKSVKSFVDLLDQYIKHLLEPSPTGASLLDDATGVESGSRRGLINAPPLQKILMWADLKKAQTWQVASFEALRSAAQSSYSTMALNKQLESFAYKDPVTGLPNRRSFSESLERAIELGSRPFAGVAIYDLDHFKQVNDRLGHQAGDRLLAHVGERMAPLMLQGACEPARLGADEFAALFLADTEEMIVDMARRMFNAITKPVSVGAEVVNADVSAGLAVFKIDEAIPSEVLRHADLALYQAKREGRGCLRLYEGQAEAITKSDRALRFEEALAKGELELHYQPKIRLKCGTLEGFEALVRWRHPSEGLIPPMEFLPMAQELGLMDQLDLWVAREAANQCESWEANGFVTNINVNLAPEHMQNKSFMLSLIDILENKASHEKHNQSVRHGRMGVEIVESSALSDVEAARGVIKELRDLGLRVALDDFGTGYSSLSYLRRLPLDELKIDQSFVRAMLSNPEDFQIVQSVVQLAGIFGLDTVAEGVENTEVARQLKAMGCEIAQGYGIARPMPAKDAFSWAQKLKAHELLRDWSWLPQNE